MSYPLLPPELYIQIIEHVGTPPFAQAGAFQLSDATIKDLLSLSVVSREFHAWTASTLYRRISLRPSQLLRLRTTLWPRSEKSRCIARWIRSLHVRWREDDQVGGRNSPTLSSSSGTPSLPSASLRDIALILHATSSTLQRLFLDIDMTDQDLNRMLIFHQPFTLNIAISSLTGLREFIFGHSSPTLVYLTLPGHSPLRRLALIGENIQNAFIERVGAFQELEQLALFSPWVRIGSSLPDVGRQFAKLFTPPISLKRLVMVTTTQHRKVATLTCEALMDGMMGDLRVRKEKDKVIVTCSREPLSWDAISDLIARGHFQDAGWETFGSKSPTVVD